MTAVRRGPRFLSSALSFATLVTLEATNFAASWWRVSMLPPDFTRLLDTQNLYFAGPSLSSGGGSLERWVRVRVRRIDLSASLFRRLTSVCDRTSPMCRFGRRCVRLSRRRVGIGSGNGVFKVCVCSDPSSMINIHRNCAGEDIGVPLESPLPWLICSHPGSIIPRDAKQPYMYQVRKYHEKMYATV